MQFKETEDDDPETLEYVNRAINREITLCRKVSHPHVIELVDSFSDAGVLHLVFELMSKNLLDLMEANPTGMELELVICAHILDLFRVVPTIYVMLLVCWLSIIPWYCY